MMVMLFLLLVFFLPINICTRIICNSVANCKRSFLHFLRLQQRLCYENGFLRDKTGLTMPGYGAVYTPGTNYMDITFIFKNTSFDTEEKFFLQNYIKNREQTFFIYTKSVSCPRCTSFFIEHVKKDKSIKINLFYSFTGYYYFKEDEYDSDKVLQKSILELYSKRFLDVKANYFSKFCKNTLKNYKNKINQRKSKNISDLKDDIEKCLAIHYSKFIDDQQEVPEISIRRAYLSNCEKKEKL